MNIDPHRKVNRTVTSNRSLEELYHLLEELEKQVREELIRFKQVLEKSGK